MKNGATFLGVVLIALCLGVGSVLTIQYFARQEQLLGALVESHQVLYRSCTQSMK